MYIGPVYDEMIDIHYAQKNLKIDTDLFLSYEPGFFSCSAVSGFFFSYMWDRLLYKLFIYIGILRSPTVFFFKY